VVHSRTETRKIRQTGRRREQTLLRRSVFVKRFSHEMTVREVPGSAAAAN
jgi:hypothetical protein